MQNYFHATKGNKTLKYSVSYNFPLTLVIEKHIFYYYLFIINIFLFFCNILFLPILGKMLETNRKKTLETNAEFMNCYYRQADQELVTFQIVTIAGQQVSTKKYTAKTK